MNIVNEIKALFKKRPSDLDRIRELLSQYTLTKEELAELAIDFTDNCMFEYSDAHDPTQEEITIENMHSNCIVEAIRLLLNAGLDPNIVVDGDNVLWNTMWMNAPNVAAATLKLLLENGGDPNHNNPADYETLFEYIAFKVSYDEYTHEYLHTVQCWLLLMAYGACFRNSGKIPITMLGDNSVEIFKNYELYDYEIEELPKEPGKYGCWIMHIYNTETKEEVAVYA